MEKTNLTLALIKLLYGFLVSITFLFHIICGNVSYLVDSENHAHELYLNLELHIINGLNKF